MTWLVVVAPGPLATMQDLGRPGLAHLGLSEGGAADRTSLRLANRLLGNDENAAAIEVTLGEFALRASGPVDVALTGAHCPAVIEGEAGRRHGSYGAPFHLAPDEILRLGRAARGVRCYLGVRGGFDVPAQLGARASDLLGGVGPAPLRPGDRLGVGADAGLWPGVDSAVWRTDPAVGQPLSVIPGPREDWFAAGALDLLGATAWRVAPDANRTAVTLDGATIERSRPGELPTEGMVRGAIQVPRSGRPTILLADHPVTGGYPVIGVVLDADVDRLAQRRPGDDVRLRVLRSAPL